MTLFEALHAEGQTILVVTHDAEIAARADRRVVLRDGRIASDEPTGATRSVSAPGVRS
jgi:ABC-type lipoprotein export system ATPase subunit